MDPDACLADILQVVREHRLGNVDIDVDGLIEDITNLDDWLKAGGFLPTRWKAQRGLGVRP